MGGSSHFQLIILLSSYSSHLRCMSGIITDRYLEPEDPTCQLWLRLCCSRGQDRGVPLQQDTSISLICPWVHHTFNLLQVFLDTTTDIHKSYLCCVLTVSNTALNSITNLNHTNHPRRLLCSLFFSVRR